MYVCVRNWAKERQRERKRARDGANYRELLVVSSPTPALMSTSDLYMCNLYFVTVRLSIQPIRMCLEEKNERVKLNLNQNKTEHTNNN